MSLFVFCTPTLGFCLLPSAPSLTVGFPHLLLTAFCLLPTDSLRAASAANRPAHFARHLLGAGKDTEKIFAQDLTNILLAVPALQ